MFRALYRTVLGPDRTRVLIRSLGRWRVPVHAALIIYAFVWAVVASAAYVRQEDSDGWWVVIFLVTLGPYVLLVWSPLYAWRPAAAGFFFVSVLMAGDGTAPFQYWTAAPLLAVVAAFYSRPIVVTATLISTVLVAFADPQAADRALYVPIVTAAVYLFGVRGRAERELEQERDAKAALEERARIAREMHDVVAHHMSMVVVRCETAPYRIPGLNSEAEKEFGDIGEAARRPSPTCNACWACSGRTARRRNANRSPASAAFRSWRGRETRLRSTWTTCRRRWASPRTGSCRRHSRTPPGMRPARRRPSTCTRTTARWTWW